MADIGVALMWIAISSASVKGLSVLARAAARDAVHDRMRASDSQTQELFGEIVEGRFGTLRQAVDRYPAVARHLRPALVASPMLVPHLLPPRRTEDLVILDAVGHLPLEEVVPTLARGRQVLVVCLLYTSPSPRD